MKQQKNQIRQKYRACMILAAVGDAIGYKNGSWQFNYSSILIHKQMMQLTNNKGPLFLKIGLDWRYSDDTVMHIATAKALTQSSPKQQINKIAQRIAKHYKICAGHMAGRAPGKTCMKTLSIIDSNATNWNKIPYSELKGGGCGASMRSACIGLFYHKNPKQLISLAIQSGRITHHNPVGYLGSVISAYFTYLAINNVNPNVWFAKLFEQVFPFAKEHIQKVGRQVESNLKSGQWQKFQKSWVQYGEARKLSFKSEEPNDPIFPQKYGIVERQHFYKTIAWTKWPGALGIDSTMIAYDAFLGCKGSWEQFVLRGILHGGDNDSTGTIGGAWFGAYYGFKDVPMCNYQNVEDNKKLLTLADNIYVLSQK